MANSTLVTVFNGTIANHQVQLCNARSLHEFLEVKNRFNDWISDRIADYGFIQDEDYIIVNERTAGRPRKEYHITLDMGKELGMVERNEKGRQIRKYFIACEKRQSQQLALPEPEPIRKIKITNHEFEALLVVLNKFIPMAQQFAEIVKAQHRQLYDVLGLERHVRNPTAAKAHDIAYEFNYWIKLARNALNRYEP